MSHLDPAIDQRHVVRPRFTLEVFLHFRSLQINSRAGGALAQLLLVRTLKAHPREKRFENKSNHHVQRNILRARQGSKREDGDKSAGRMQSNYAADDQHMCSTVVKAG